MTPYSYGGLVYASCCVVLYKIKFLGKQVATKKVSKKALKVEEKPLRDYEMILIIGPEVVDEKLDVVVDGISRFIAEKDGSISEVEQWGKRKLAYPIKHFMEGSYVLMRFKLRLGTSKELEANLRISDEVLRHLLIKLES